jgi:heat shock protein HslJ
MKKLFSITSLIVLMTLFVPAVSLAQSPTCEFEYTVQAGDWLSRIADKYFGDALAYPAIVEATNAQTGEGFTGIDNPDLIKPGWVLCIPPADGAAASTQPAPEGLSPQELANATYKSEWTQDGTAPLVNGEYSEQAAPGSATMTTVRLTDNIAYGQLNNQAVAAVVLVTDPGGSGTFYDLAVVVNQNGTPTNVATTSLGDRVQINSSNVENNQIVVDMVQAGPDDPLCCPSQQVLKTFELQGDQPVEVSSQVTESESSPELVDTIWRWDQTLMNNDDAFVPDNPNNYTVQFLPDGTVSIQADCNRVGGSYTTDGSSITIETGPTTLVACPPGSLGDAFVSQLSGVAIYFFEGQNLFLDLKFDSGTMRFSAQSTELAGTSWIVTGYNNGREAVVSVIIGSEITANFGADGQLTGSAGCNNYFASYTTDGDNITIGPAGSTQQFCSEPEGIMAQEQEYLTALQTAATYSNRGDTLDLRTASGARAAAFQAVQ